MRLLPLALLMLPALGTAGGGYVGLPGGIYKSVLAYEDTGGNIPLAAFDLMRQPVTNAEFLEFVRRHPQWQRPNVPSVFAESRYLSHWAGAMELGSTALPDQPVVQVSWFAASAYCEADAARLPTWNEWEYAAAADETRRDARADPAWRTQILSWYSRPSNQALAQVGQSPANYYGVQDLHGLVWEWTEDYASMLVSADNRTQNEQDRLQFCGAGAIAMDDRENYAVLMRVALLSSMEGAHLTSNLGFRCARNVTGTTP